MSTALDARRLAMHHKRKRKNAIALTLSLGAMAFGVFWLIWILFETIYLGIGGLSLATFTRVVIFAVAGVYSDFRLLVLALCLLPAMVLGMWIGERITLRLTRMQFLRVLHLILIGAGLTLCAHVVRWGERVTPLAWSDAELPASRHTALELVAAIRARKAGAAARSGIGLNAAHLVDQAGT